MDVKTSGSARTSRSAGLVDGMLDWQSFGPDGRRRGWFGAVMSLVWLVYLIGPIRRNWSGGEHARAVAAMVCVLAFAALIVVAFVVFRRYAGEGVPDDLPVDRRAWLLLAAMGALSAAMGALLGGDALPTAIYVAVVAVFVLPLRTSAVVVVAIMAIMLLAPVAAPAWHLGGTPFYLAFIPVAVWLARQLGLRGDRLAELARRQRAELEIIEERNRVARDVHDILGHSLTVITVKTELAQRLLDVDPNRARTELADIERLAREALAGVRETVGGLREVSLRGELANARTALAAAGIDAELPQPASLPDTPSGELLGWVLREAVTNVVRHSAAGRCAVTVTATSIEVVDDGRGLPADSASGSGLAGLRERVRAAGGTLTLSTPEGGGVRVRATIPE
ncbi:sensor histidine kinase [Nocardia araoensis]|uniref:sensor histidine kinase n=1 Tax=Nocardia araoensis TaxID=228600 RepID=UPI0002E01530|nr:sensor histidine kinase [Nocardia araoensis]